jgi:hypothetical protein
MGSKLLFILGIVAAHSAIAAALVKQEAPHPRSIAASCVDTPDIALPDFTPHSEIYASLILHTGSFDESAFSALQP